MSSPSLSKVLVAQGGGPTAVINQSMVGVVLESRKFHHVEKVFSIPRGTGDRQ
jgi:6-phosphofructokinase 1